MEAKPLCSHDAGSLLNQRVNEDLEEWHDVKPEVILLAAEGRDKEEHVLVLPEHGAAAAEEEGEKELRREEGNVGTEVPGLIDAKNHECGGASCGDQVQEKQEEEPIPKGTEHMASLQPLNRQPPFSRTRLTPWQLQELESIFQRNRYPNRPAQKELARYLDVTEEKVQIWFKNRRAKLRRQQKRSVC